MITNLDAGNRQVKVSKAGYLDVISNINIQEGITANLNVSLVHDPQYLVGWPQAAGDNISTPTLVDLDGDGKLEVIASSYDSKVYAWHSNGTPVAGWPQATEWWVVNASPAVADIDGDGIPEVVVGSGTKVYAWHGDGTLVAGWPKTTDGGYTDAALVDLDDDGKLDVVVGDQKKVYAWHGDGTPVAGWPKTTVEGWHRSLAVADLDTDGKLEVVLTCLDNKIYAWHSDGTPVAGWPTTTGDWLISDPTIGDIDGDGKLEVIVGGMDGKVYAWHRNGTAVTGWPKTPIDGGWPESAAIADLDGDGKLEVIVASSYNDVGKVYAWYSDGTSIAGWPKTIGEYIYTSPAIADIDGDGKLEVVVGSQNHVYAWHSDGTAVSGWPKQTKDVVYSLSIADLNSDGKLEVVAGSRDETVSGDYVYVWSFDSQAIDRYPWPMFQHDSQHTGCYNCKKPLIAPTVTVVSPNNGEKWARGKSFNVNWSSTGLTATDKINISLKNYATNATSSIKSNLAGNSLSYSWPIPLTFAVWWQL